MQCTEVMPEVSLKMAVAPASPSTLLHRAIHRRLSQDQATAGRRARRRLFSAVDPDEVSRFVRRELAAVRAADRRRYNFDFERLQPLEGRFQWERVGGGGGMEAVCENSPVHRSARRLQLDCPLSDDCPGAPGGDGHVHDHMAPAPSPAAGPVRHRICLQPAGDAPTKVLQEKSQLVSDQSHCSCLRSSAASERLSGARLKQTVLTGKSRLK